MTNKKIIFNQVFQHCRLVWYFSLLFSCFSNLMLLAIPMYSLQVLDRVISSGSQATLMMLTLATLLAISLLALMQWIRAKMMTSLGVWLEQQLGPFLWTTALGVGVSSKDYQPRELLHDFQLVKQSLTGASVNALLDVPWTILFVLALWLIHPLLAVLSLVGIGILFLLAIADEYYTKPTLDEANRVNLMATQEAQLAIQQAEVITAMAMMPATRARWWQQATRALSLQQYASHINACIVSLTRFMRLVLQTAVTGCGAYLVLKQQITMGAMIAAGILVGRALAPFENAIGSWKAVVVAKKAWVRLQQRLAVLTEPEASLTLPTPQGKLQVHDLVFTVKGKKKPVLQNISFALNPGELCAIVGPSAAGKSTLAKLITGIWQATQGSIRLDGADVYLWSQAGLGQYLGYLPQDIALFAGSVKENIARLQPDANDASIIEAAQAAQVHELILQLEQGYETVIDNKASQLSQGQQQRIALARAFYANPKLLVLDEPNANLDHAGEQALATALTACQGKITTIIISHRPAVLQLVDKILVLQAGSQVAFGDRDDILQRLQQPKLLAQANHSC